MFAAPLPVIVRTRKPRKRQQKGEPLVQHGRRNLKCLLSIVVTLATLATLTAGVGALAAGTSPQPAQHSSLPVAEPPHAGDEGRRLLSSARNGAVATRSASTIMPSGQGPAGPEHALDGPLPLSGTRLAQAEEGVGSAAQCFFEFTLTLNPGLTATPSTGTLSTGGETGSIACYGPVRGAMPSGVGTMGVEGTYGVAGGDSCAGGVASGTGAFTVPTPAGPKRMEGPFVVNYYSSGVGYFTAAVDGGTSNFSGAVEFSPVAGDCINSPMTTIRVVGQGTASGA